MPASTLKRTARRSTEKPGGATLARVSKAKTKRARKASGDDRQLTLADQGNVGMSARTAYAGAACAADDEMPHRPLADRMWNAFAGLSLLPFVCIFSIALYHTFLLAMRKSQHLPFWNVHEFQMFALGAGMWLTWTALSFLLWKRPRPVRAYVLGHEVMHGMMAKAFGGRVKEFHVTADGGHIVTNKYNFLIALAPYLWPFYSVPVLAAWGILHFFNMPQGVQPMLLAAFGFTWMFHLTFTLWVLPRGQSESPRAGSHLFHPPHLPRQYHTAQRGAGSICTGSSLEVLWTGNLGGYAGLLPWGRRRRRRAV